MIKKIIIMLISLFLLTGCFDYKEMSDLAFVSALAIEKIDNEYKLTVQINNITNTINDTGTDAAKSLVLSGYGKTLLDAIRDMSDKTPRTLYFSQAKVVILDDSVLIKEELNDIIDLLLRDIEISLNYYIVTCINNNPEDILSSLSPFESNTVSDITKTTENSERLNGIGEQLTIRDFARKYLSYGIENIYTDIELTNNEENADNSEYLKDTKPSKLTFVKDMVTINNNDEIYILSKDEAFGYNFLKNNLNNPVITLSCKDKEYTVEINNPKTKISFDKDNKSFIIESNVNTSIHDYNCNMDLHKESTTKYIKESVNNEVNKYINSTIESIIKNRSDYVGFGNILYKNYPKYFDFKNNNWNEEINNYNFKTKIKVNIIKQGNLYGGINYENKTK